MAGGFDARIELLTQQAREDERRRIARDLHDDISQQFALLTITLDLLRQHPAASNPDMRQRLDAILERALDIGSRVRHVSHQLHASTLDDLGQAVLSFCHEISAHHDIDIRILSDAASSTLRGALALTLFRIIQEALQNVVRHSGARHVTLEIAARPDALVLRIADDGRGFDVAAQDGSGMGLMSMRERLALFDGQLSIGSSPSHGTRIEVSVPMWRAATAAA
jgi:signal transduction histidine kinase